MGAMKSETTASVTVGDQLPLTLPVELWAGLDKRQRRLYRCAQKVLDHLLLDNRTTLEELSESVSLKLSTLLSALQVLDEMELITIDPGSDGPEFRVLATPDTHVKVVGPHGKPLWVFIARPLKPPELDYSELN